MVIHPLQPKDIFNEPHQSIEDRVNAMAQLPLAYQPGKKWSYSAAPDILALLIEKFSGMPVDRFLEEHIFTPLGMKDTGYNLTDEQKKRVATLHLQDTNNQQSVNIAQTPSQGKKVFGGTHGLFSTANDYMRFCQMLLNKGVLEGKRILGRKTIELMTSDYAKERYEQPGVGFGLGFAVRTDVADSATLGSVGQFYWSGLFNTYFFIDPKEEMAAILMMQFLPYKGGVYNEKFRALVYQALE